MMYDFVAGATVKDANNSTTPTLHCNIALF